MDDRPLVTVIVPAHNSGRWIAGCIRSIGGQTYPNLEIIVVDDGSEDDTVRIIKGLGIKLNLIEQKNRGVSDARNAGIEKAAGKYIAFLDGDDLLTETSVEERVAFLEDNPECGYVFTDAIEFDEGGDLRLFLDQFPWLDLERDQFLQLLRNCFPLTSSIMVRKEILDKVGGFDTHLKHAEDLELQMRIALVSKAGMLRKPLTRRRIHAGQAISSTFNRWDSRVFIFSHFKPVEAELSTDHQLALYTALKHAWFKLGEWYWENFDLKKARECFHNSLGPYEWKRQAKFYSMLSCLPLFCVKLMRKIKGRQPAVKPD